MAYQSLVWRETIPGQWERDIDELEQFYTCLAKTWESTGKTYFAITAHLTFSVPVSAEESVSQLDARIDTAFRKAWKRMRYDHPTLAAPVFFDESRKKCRKIYRTPGIDHDKNGDAWVDQTLRLFTNGQSGLGFANNDPEVPRLATLYLLKPAVQSTQNIIRREVVFRSSHDLIDGVGTLILLNNLMHQASEAFSLQDAYGQVEFGDEYQNLSPPFRIAAEIPPEPQPSQRAKLEKIQRANQNARRDGLIMAVPMSSSAEVPLNSKRVAIYLTETESQSVIRKSKELGVTPTHVFHAGIAISVRDLQVRMEHERIGTYISYSLLNLRGACKTPYKSALYAAAVYHGVSANSLAVNLTIPSVSSAKMEQSTVEFLRAVREVKDFYDRASVDEDYLSIVPKLFENVSPPYPEQPCKIPSPNKSPSASLSSMGIIDRIIQPDHGPFSIVSDPWVTGAEYSTGLGIFLSTWKGVMSLSAAYNEAFHEEPEVFDFLKHIRKVVLEGSSMTSSDAE